MKHTTLLFILIFSFLLISPALGDAADATPGEAQKVLYLTFDDGPKASTPELLDILKTYDAPATFFLVGQGIQNNPEAARAIYEAGHAIGTHTFYHSTKQISKSEAAFDRDMEHFDEVMSAAIGEPFHTSLLRFPYGSGSAKPRVRTYAQRSGYLWVDWNCLTGDAVDMNASEEALYRYTLKTCGKNDTLVLLMHEGSMRTRHILPRIIEHFRNLGYELRSLSADSDLTGLPHGRYGLPLPPTDVR